MRAASDFLREFQSALDGVSLPEPVAEDYRLDSCLSGGPQDGVWLVRRKRDGERFILRIARDRDLREEFEAMSRLPEGLPVPRPVSLFEEDGTQYLIRTYLPGRPLAEVWEKQSEARCVHLGAALCALLDRLHRLSPPIIHRDIKPENIIISPEGAPGLIDFGIARDYDPARDTDTVCMGTRSTAAPEQYGFAQSDQRTDLYALGVTLRWMLTGSYLPEALDTAACSEGMKRFLRKATAFDPADRFPSAAAMGAALRRLGRSRRGFLLIPACLLALLLAAGARFFILPVDFSSPLLEQAVRLELDMPQGAVTRRDLTRVRRLAVVGRETLDGERQFRCNLDIYVDEVSQDGLPRGDISDLSLLAEMPCLSTLYLCRQEISDLSPLRGLPLRELYLSDNHIEDFSPLEGLSGLEVLYLGSNPSVDYSPLSSLRKLRELNLDCWNWSEPESLTPLEKLPVESLSLGNLLPQDGDWSFLGTLGNLHTLWLWSPPWAAVTALEGCGGLRALSLGNYGEADLSRLPAMPQLYSLSVFNVLPSIEGIQMQTGLYWLNLCNLEGLDLAPAASLPRLKEINFFNVHPPSCAPLADIPALERVSVDTEEFRAMVEADCPERRFEIVRP